MIALASTPVEQQTNTVTFLSFESLGRVLDGEGVAVEFADGTEADGFWEWVGQTGDDFYLVRINELDGSLIVGADVRTFTKVTVL